MIGSAMDWLWQRLHCRVASCNLALYDLPSDCWAARFLAMQTELWRDVHLQQCNSEKALAFVACILWKVRDIKRFVDVKPLIWHRLDTWDAGKFVGLVKGVKDAALICGFGVGHG